MTSWASSQKLRRAEELTANETLRVLRKRRLIRASAAIRTLLHKSMAESARNCCNAMNPHKAIVLPNADTVYYKSLYPQCSADATTPPTSACGALSIRH